MGYEPGHNQDRAVDDFVLAAIVKAKLKRVQYRHGLLLYLAGTCVVVPRARTAGGPVDDWLWTVAADFAPCEGNGLCVVEVTRNLHMDVDAVG
jgi:hypothetical protein